MPRDIRTWLIVVLVLALVVVIVAVPTLRESVAAWLVWLGVLLGGAKARGRDDDDVDTTTEAHDLKSETEDAAADEMDPQTDDLIEDLEELGRR